MDKTLTSFGRRTVLTGMFATLFALPTMAAAIPNYTNASLTGVFVLTDHGTIQQSQSPYAAVATLNFDGNGNVTGLHNYVAGAYSAMGNAVTGTYTVGTAGWGTLALQIALNDGSGTLIQANYLTLLTTSGLVIERSDGGIFAEAALMQQPKHAFAITDGSGTYVLQEHGYSANGAFILIGALAVDSLGNVSGSATYSSFGNYYPASVTGFCSVAANGAGNMTMTLTVTNADGSTTPYNFNYLLNVVSSGGTIAAISADPGTTAVAMLNAR